MKILIVKLSALGDVVHALPVLAHLHGAVREPEVHWLVEEGFSSLLEGHPLIDKVIPVATRRWRREGGGAFLRGVREVARQLRSEGYDLALDLQGNSKSGLFTRLSGAPSRYGFARDGAREWPNLLATNHRVPLAGAHHVSDRSLAIARRACPAEVAVAPAGPLQASAQALAEINPGLAGLDSTGPLVVCHYGTTWATKLWPVENWRELLSRMAEAGCRLLLTWGDDKEKVIVEELAGISERVTVWPRGTLPGLVALLAEADMVIGGDTGPVHIAAAVGTPTVSWYRVTDATRNGPRGPGHILLQAPMDCSPCLRKSCDLDRECGHSITPDQVFDAAMSLLAGGKDEQL